VMAQSCYGGEEAHIEMAQSCYGGEEAHIETAQSCYGDEEAHIEMAHDNWNEDQDWRLAVWNCLNLFVHFPESCYGAVAPIPHSPEFSWASPYFRCCSLDKPLSLMMKYSRSRYSEPFTYGTLSEWRPEVDFNPSGEHQGT